MDRKKGMLIGEKGVQYGLQLRRGPGSAAASAKPAPPRPKPANVFGAESDSDEDVGAQVARQADKKRAAAKVQQVYEDALAQDASVFDYDGVYDSMQEQKVQPKQQEKIERKSRYIAQLKEQAEQRKREDDISFERRQIKERAKEDHLFEDKEVFVTAAYKKKLEEQKLWQEQEKLKEEEEANMDVRKIGHMGNFYANLLTSNVAMGTGSTKLAATDAGVSDKHREGQKNAQEKPEFSEEQLAKAAARAGVTLDKYEIMRLEAEKARRRRQQQQVTANEQDGGEAVPITSDVHNAMPSGSGSLRNVPGGEEANAAEADAPVVALAAGKRRNDDTSVQSARERYLARKKQQAG
mmetsp:Transcript_14263/g.41560  ORF Transcript_14263/g.41560 Transcript_14263/m.41560 type:complete len:352 (-) Transcript_14263:2205-3260(-)